MGSPGILFVVPWFGEFAGGAEVQARTMALELERRGIGIMVYSTCSKSPYDSWWDDFYPAGPCRVHGLPTVRFRVSGDRERYQRAVERSVRGEGLSPAGRRDFFLCGLNSDDLVTALRQPLEEGWEVLALPYFQGLAHAAAAAYPGRVSVIPCLHDEPQLLWECVPELLVNARHIFFNSPEEKDLAIRHYGRLLKRKLVEAAVTGEGVELRPVEHGEQPGGQLPGSYFVYVGRKERGKNVHLLCQWFTEYRKCSGSETCLVFVGGGDASLVPSEPGFIDLGFVPEARKRAVLSGALGLLNLSEMESFSLVIMEAWLLGRPVVVTARCAVTAGHARRSGGGLVAGGFREFSGTLDLLSRRRDLGDALGRQGRAYVEKEYSFDTVLARYLGRLGTAGRE